MIWNRIPCNGNVLCTACSAGGFGKIDWHAFPQHVVPTLLDLVDPGSKLFVVTDRDGLPEFLVAGYLVKTCVLAKFRGPASLEEGPEYGILVGDRRSHRFPDTFIYIGGKWPG